MIYKAINHNILFLGVLDSCFSLNPVEEMVGAGLVSLLRSCLDEKEESVVFSATQCLANLLYSQVEIIVPNRLRFSQFLFCLNSEKVERFIFNFIKF